MNEIDLGINIVQKNKLFLDSANLDEIELALVADVVCGITTNPSLMAKEKVDTTNSDQFTKYCNSLLTITKLIEKYGKINNMVYDLSLEIIPCDTMDDFEQAKYLSTFLPLTNTKISVKIPFLFKNLPLIKNLVKAGINVNATAIMTCNQAKIANELGAQIVSFFYNRMIDFYLKGDINTARNNADCEIINFCKEFNGVNGKKSEVYCGSIRKAKDLLDCWLNGVDVVTAPYKIIKEMIDHPKTIEAVDLFDKDIQKWLGESK